MVSARRLRRVVSMGICLALLPGISRAQQNPDIVAAGDLLVELDAGHDSAGTPEWENTADDAFTEVFIEVGDPIVEEKAGVPAVTFNMGATDDAYRSGSLDGGIYVPENAPAGITGLDPTRSIEVWVYNEAIADEETMVAWGRRGGPAGSNMSFNYGRHGAFGAVGHWGAPDIGWVDNAFTAGAPVAGVWHHLVYTFDGSITSVYADGCKVDEFDCPQNSEDLGISAINTHVDFPVVIGAQTVNDALDIDFAPGAATAREGSLSIGRIRVHDEVLNAEDVLNNFEVECEEFCPPEGPPECLNCPDDDVHTRGKTIYKRQIEVFAVPALTRLTVTQPAGASISPTGELIYEVPGGIQDGFSVEVEAENDSGVMIFSWNVNLLEPIESNPNLEVAGELLVDLDATDSATAGGRIWQNPGAMNDLVEIGDPVLVEVAGVPAVEFNSGDTDDAYQTPEPAPDGLVGVDPTRSIEVWVFNPEVAGEETMVAWGRRGGPEGTNMSFNYGNNGNFGAVGHWGGGPDIGWVDNAGTGGNPIGGEWHHLVYTFDGGATHTTRVYDNGLLQNSETHAPGVINTHGGQPVTLATQIVNDAGDLDFGAREGVLAIARVRVHDEVLALEQIQSNFNEERDEFGVGEIPDQPPLISNVPVDDRAIEGGLYSVILSVSGSPPPELTVESPEGAQISAEGVLTYQVPSPAPDSFEVEVLAENSAGENSAFWIVSVTKAETIEAGPVHRYSFDGNADDSVGGAHGTAMGDVIIEAGQATLNNDGSQNSNDLEPGAYIDLPNGIISALGPNATFEAWITWNGPAGSAWQRVFDFGTSASGEDFSDGAANNQYVFMTPNSGPGTYRAGYRDVQGLGAGVEQWAEGPGPVPIGVEHHLVLTWDGDSLINSIYLDGLLVGQDLAVHMALEVIPDVNNWLGRSQWPDAMLSGSYNEFRIYDYALTEQQVLGNFLTGPDCVNVEGEPCEPGGDGPRFVRGDSDASNAINITDGIHILNFLFLGGEAPPCQDAADADDSGAVNITDGIYVLNFLFLGGPPPRSPYPDCGEDPEGPEDGVTCLEDHPCEG